MFKFLFGPIAAALGISRWFNSVVSKVTNMYCVCELFPTPFLGFIQHDHCHIADYGSAEKAQEYNEQNFQIQATSPPFLRARIFVF